jgi:hypothetical protein
MTRPRESECLLPQETDLTSRRSSCAGNERKFLSKSQGKVNAAVIPLYADSFLSVLCCVNSGHRARLFPLVLDVVAHLRSFTTHVWHSSLRVLGKGHGNVPAQIAVTVALRGCFKQKHIPTRSAWVKRKVTAAHCQNPIGRIVASLLHRLFLDPNHTHPNRPALPLGIFQSRPLRLFFR